MRYLTVPISGQCNLASQGDAGDSSNAGTLHYGGPGSRSNAYSRGAGKLATGALTRGGSGSRSKSAAREAGGGTHQAVNATPARSAERTWGAITGQGHPGEAAGVGLYQQSFDPASRMIQKQRYLK